MLCVAGQQSERPEYERARQARDVHTAWAEAVDLTRWMVASCSAGDVSGVPAILPLLDEALARFDSWAARVGHRLIEALDGPATACVTVATDLPIGAAIFSSRRLRDRCADRMPRLQSLTRTDRSMSSHAARACDCGAWCTRTTHPEMEWSSRSLPVAAVAGSAVLGVVPTSRRGQPGGRQFRAPEGMLTGSCGPARSTTGGPR